MLLTSEDSKPEGPPGLKSRFRSYQDTRQLFKKVWNREELCKVVQLQSDKTCSETSLLHQRAWFICADKIYDVERVIRKLTQSLPSRATPIHNRTCDKCQTDSEKTKSDLSSESNTMQIDECGFGDFGYLTSTFIRSLAYSDATDQILQRFPIDIIQAFGIYSFDYTGPGPNGKLNQNLSLDSCVMGITKPDVKPHEMKMLYQKNKKISDRKSKSVNDDMEPENTNNFESMFLKLVANNNYNSVLLLKAQGQGDGLKHVDVMDAQSRHVTTAKHIVISSETESDDGNQNLNAEIQDQVLDQTSSSFEQTREIHNDINNELEIGSGSESRELEESEDTTTQTSVPTLLGVPVSNMNQTTIESDSNHNMIGVQSISDSESSATTVLLCSNKSQRPKIYISASDLNAEKQSTNAAKKFDIESSQIKQVSVQNRDFQVECPSEQGSQKQFCVQSGFGSRELDESNSEDEDDQTQNAYDSESSMLIGNESIRSTMGHSSTRSYEDDFELESESATLNTNSIIVNHGSSDGDSNTNQSSNTNSDLDLLKSEISNDQYYQDDISANCQEDLKSSESLNVSEIHTEPGLIVPETSVLEDNYYVNAVTLDQNNNLLGNADANANFSDSNCDTNLQNYLETPLAPGLSEQQLKRILGVTSPELDQIQSPEIVGQEFSINDDNDEHFQDNFELRSSLQRPELLENTNYKGKTILNLDSNSESDFQNSLELNNLQQQNQIDFESDGNISANQYYSDQNYSKMRSSEILFVGEGARAHVFSTENISDRSLSDCQSPSTKSNIDYDIEQIPSPPIIKKFESDTEFDLEDADLHLASGLRNKSQSGQNVTVAYTTVNGTNESNQYDTDLKLDTQSQTQQSESYSQSPVTVIKHNNPVYKHDSESAFKDSKAPEDSDEVRIASPELINNDVQGPSDSNICDRYEDINTESDSFGNVNVTINESKESYNYGSQQINDGDFDHEKNHEILSKDLILDDIKSDTDLRLLDLRFDSNDSSQCKFNSDTSNFKFNQNNQKSCKYRGEEGTDLNQNKFNHYNDEGYTPSTRAATQVFSMMSRGDSLQSDGSDSDSQYNLGLDDALDSQSPNTVPGNVPTNKFNRSFSDSIFSRNFDKIINNDIEIIASMVIEDSDQEHQDIKIQEGEFLGVNLNDNLVYNKFNDTVTSESANQDQIRISDSVTQFQNIQESKFISKSHTQESSEQFECDDEVLSLDALGLEQLEETINSRSPTDASPLICKKKRLSTEGMTGMLNQIDLNKFNFDSKSELSNSNYIEQSESDSLKSAEPGPMLLMNSLGVSNLASQSIDKVVKPNTEFMKRSYSTNSYDIHNTLKKTSEKSNLSATNSDELSKYDSDYLDPPTTLRELYCMMPSSCFKPCFRKYFVSIFMDIICLLCALHASTNSNMVALWMLQTLVFPILQLPILGYNYAIGSESLATVGSVIGFEYLTILTSIFKWCIIIPLLSVTLATCYAHLLVLGREGKLNLCFQKKNVLLAITSKENTNQSFIDRLRFIVRSNLSAFCYILGLIAQGACLCPFSRINTSATCGTQMTLKTNINDNLTSRNYYSGISINSIFVSMKISNIDFFLSSIICALWCAFYVTFIFENDKEMMLYVVLPPLSIAVAWFHWASGIQNQNPSKLQKLADRLEEGMVMTPSIVNLFFGTSSQSTPPINVRVVRSFFPNIPHYNLTKASWALAKIVEDRRISN